MRTSRNADPLESVGITRDQSVLYTAILKLHRATAAEIAEAVDEPADAVLARMDRLVRLGAVDEQAGEYLARHPAATIGRLVAERMNQLARESREIDQVLASIDHLTHHYDAGRDREAREFPIELVSGQDELFKTVTAHAVERGSPTSLVCVVPDRRTMSDFVEETSDKWLQAFNEGILSCRGIVPAAAMTVPGFREICERLNDAGTQIRTLNHVPSWFFALGDDTAGLPVQWGGSLPDHAYNCYLVRAPIVVAALRALFEELWARATPLASPTGTIQVLRLASQGMGDQCIARHLGLSVRTVRARFAEAMADLGAKSRFHAGVEAARRGLL
jgi:DNA-binding CsgD family transcriptional regulator